MFTSRCSLEDLATGVRILGLPDLLKLIDKSSKGSAEDFFFMLNNLLLYRKNRGKQPINHRKNTILTATQYFNRLDRIDEKIG